MKDIWLMLLVTLVQRRNSSYLWNGISILLLGAILGATEVASKHLPRITRCRCRECERLSVPEGTAHCQTKVPWLSSKIRLIECPMTIRQTSLSTAQQLEMRRTTPFSAAHFDCKAGRRTEVGLLEPTVLANEHCYLRETLRWLDLST